MTVPNSLTNGTVADATEVSADFDYISDDTASRFNTSTGHDHDGTDSKAIAVTLSMCDTTVHSTNSNSYQTKHTQTFSNYRVGGVSLYRQRDNTAYAVEVKVTFTYTDDTTLDVEETGITDTATYVHHTYVNTAPEDTVKQIDVLIRTTAPASQNSVYCTNITYVGI